MISLNISILYQIVLFVVLWLILNKLLFQPYLRLLDERERRTTGAQRDSADLEQEGERLRARYQEKIAQGQAAGYAAKEAILQEARAERAKILAEARQAAAQNLEGVRSEIAAAMERERRLAASEAAALAEEMASKALGRRVA
jgi:F-type H+-transporting ATPase subunit b